MSSIKCQIAVSLDGFVAGPNQCVADLIGEGGMRLHEWLVKTASWREGHGQEGGERGADSEVVEEAFKGIGAHIMGRRMFGGGEGPWDETWRGWWGEDPPFHAPVFGSPTTRASRCRCRAARRSTSSPTGSSRHSNRRERRPGTATSRSPAAQAPCSNTSRRGCSMSSSSTSSRSSLGAGERLLEDVGDPTFEPVEVIASPAVTHVKYRVVR
jgi:hypothetical protein